MEKFLICPVSLSLSRSKDYFGITLLKDALALFKDFSEVECIQFEEEYLIFNLMFAGRENYMEKTNINIFLDKLS